LCNFFGFSRQAYYKQLREKLESSSREQLVVDLVHRSRRRNKKLGVRKIYNKFGPEIHKINAWLGRDKLFSLLRRRGLLIKRRRKYAVTTNSNHRFRKYSNEIQNFTAVRPHQAWVGDMTFIRTKQGFTHLFLLTDVYSRKIVGWHLTKSPDVESAGKAARMAIRQCPDTRGLIHHSDRGFQYCSPRYVKILQSQKIVISMGEIGNCYENAMAERVNGILKDEYGLDATFKDMSEALRATKESIKDYNEERPHWGLKLKIPSEVHDS
jgi:transposase InsO family protein